MGAIVLLGGLALAAPADASGEGILCVGKILDAEAAASADPSDFGISVRSDIDSEVTRTFGSEAGECTALAPPPGGQSAAAVQGDPLTICVFVSLGDQGAPFTSPSATVFTTTVGGVTTTGIQPLGSMSCGSDSFEFAVTRGADVEIVQTESGAPEVGPGAVECVAPASSFTAAGTAGRVQFVAPLDGDFVVCQFLNDAVRICVNKTVGPALGLRAGPADFSFDVTVDARPSALLTPDPIVGRVCFHAAPHAAITIREVPGNAIPMSRSTSISCSGLFQLEVAGDLLERSVSFSLNEIDPIVECDFTNEATDLAMICIEKFVTGTAADAGVVASNFGIVMTVDGGAPEDLGAFGPPTCAPSEATIETVVPRESTVHLRELNLAGVPAGPSEVVCLLEAGPLSGDAATGVIAFDAVSELTICQFVNDSVPVTVTKSVVNDHGGSADALDFVFEVDVEGMSPITVGSGERFFVAPGGSFSITEQTVAGYEPITASCVASSDDNGDLGTAESTGGGSVSFAVPAGAVAVECSFVNDDVARAVPVCARLDLDPGSTPLTLQDFDLVLTDGSGTALAERQAAGPGDPTCVVGSETAGVASLIPGDLVRLGSVVGNGSLHRFVVAGPVDTASLNVDFGPSSCVASAPSGDVVFASDPSPGPSSDPVPFTVDADVVSVICHASARARVIATTPALPFTPLQSNASGAPTPTPAPLVPAPARTPPTHLAVTGPQSRDGALPTALGLLGLGFGALGIARKWREMAEES